ncbi:MAG: ATP-binding protein [Anaerolineae bacterium]
MVKLNVDLMERALANLLDNAIKYTPEGGVVNVRAYNAGNQVMIEVQDSGRGIAEKGFTAYF